MKAADVLTKTEPGRAERTIMGGLGGTLSMTDLIRARKDYTNYRIDAESGAGDVLTFEEFVRQEWKK